VIQPEVGRGGLKRSGADRSVDSPRVLDLSPTKLLIIFVVAVLLLGPQRLPTFARQLGAGWRRLREVHSRFDTEVREAMPDLPSSQQLARFARSPMTLLNRLADLPADGQPADRLAADARATPDTPYVPVPEPEPEGTTPVRRPPAPSATVVPDDPTLN
jgi:Sec-independent protein translocase protein TatA